MCLSVTVTSWAWVCVILIAEQEQFGGSYTRAAAGHPLCCTMLKVCSLALLQLLEPALGSAYASHPVCEEGPCAGGTLQHALLAPATWAAPSPGTGPVPAHSSHMGNPALTCHAGDMAVPWGDRGRL